MSFPLLPRSLSSLFYGLITFRSTAQRLVCFFWDFFSPESYTSHWQSVSGLLFKKEMKSHRAPSFHIFSFKPLDPCQTCPIPRSAICCRSFCWLALLCWLVYYFINFPHFTFSAAHVKIKLTLSVAVRWTIRNQIKSMSKQFCSIRMELSD